MEIPRAPGPAAKLFPSLAILAVLSVLPSAAAGGAAREYESGDGRLRITVVAVSPPEAGRPSPSDSSAPDPSPAAEPPAACIAADSIGDFASPAGICRNGDALLQVDYYDKAAMRELRFPLKYSELRRYLLGHPLAYRQGTADERAVRLIADLAAHLRIEMRDPSRREEKP